MYLKAILSHLILCHPYCCVVCQNMQRQILLVELSDKVADGSERGQIKVQIFDFADAATSASNQIQLCFGTAYTSPVEGGLRDLHYGLHVLGLTWDTASSTYAWPFASFRVAKITCAPHPTNALMISNPRPVLPPVTMATLPSRSTLVIKLWISFHFCESLAMAFSTMFTLFGNCVRATA